MVAPPQQIWSFQGYYIGLNAALTRIEELRYSIGEMRRDTDRMRRDMSLYISFLDELAWLLNQVNNH